jgi:sensor histidine kinase YesM
VPEAILNEDLKVPPLIIQPYVENAILHGLRNRPGNDGKLLISLSRKDDYLHYVIEDNGVGRSAAKTNIRQENVSYGMAMTRDRVKLFNKETDASVLITDLEENEQPAGTRIEVRLKIQ